MIQKPSDLVKDTHLKSLLDVVYDNSVKRLNSLREELKENPQNRSKREREFLTKECAKLQTLGSLQTKLDEYRAKHSQTTPGQKNDEAAFKNGSDVLGNHLRAIGQFKYGKNWHAHHIICSRHPSHAMARFTLFAYMGINDPHNGCWLPTKRKYAAGTPLPNAVGHVYVHTEEYARWVARKVVGVSSTREMITRLADIRRGLHDTKNMPDILTKKGKDDLLKRC